MRCLHSHVVCVLLALAALMVGGAFANGIPPVIGNLPDIEIGNVEDNMDPAINISPGQTLDIGFYRFPFALDLDDYVCDLDTTITQISWSFYEDPAGPDGAIDNFEINGVTQLDDPTSAVAPNDKEITGREFPGLRSPVISIWDIKACPLKDGLPFPYYYGTAQELSEQVKVSFFASDGTSFDSKTITINSVNGGFDRLLPDPIIGVVYPFDDATAEGWRPFIIPAGTYIPDVLGDYYIAQTEAKDGMISILNGEDSPTSMASAFSNWQTMPDTFIEYQQGFIYRARFTLKTDQPDPLKAPQVRIRWSDLPELIASGQLIDKGQNALTTDWATYDAFYHEPTSNVPKTCKNLRLFMDLIDFTPEQMGSVFCDSIEVSRLLPPDPADLTHVITYDTPIDFEDWSYFTSELLDVATSGTTTEGGVSIETPEPIGSKPLYFGIWMIDPLKATYAFEANKMYKATFTLKSESHAAMITLPTIRVRIGNGAWDWVSFRNFRQVMGASDQEPAPDGTNYEVFFPAPPNAASGRFPWPEPDAMVLSFDVYDAMVTEYGKVTLDKVTVESFDGF
ncbi:MAG TPA: hypothetical protein PLB62_06175 [Candidatus Sumerlaeota bacterium]|nr:hypothetical protein [Candidatus Sumerlaeota bacterium]